MPGSRVREIVRRSLGALTATALLGAAVAVGAGLSWPGTVRATDGAPTSAVPSPASRQPAANPTASPTRTVVPTRTISPIPTNLDTPENVANADPECQRPCRQSRHRHHGAPRPRRELLRQ